MKHRRTWPYSLSLFNDHITSGGTSFFAWGGQRGQDILGGKSIWLPITHFHNTGHILYYLKFPSLSLDLFFPFASYGSFPPLFHSHLPPSPFIQLGVWGSAVSSPAGPGGARPPNGIWWILSAVFSKLSYWPICFWFSDSMNCSGQFTNVIFTNVSK